MHLIASFFILKSNNGKPAAKYRHHYGYKDGVDQYPTKKIRIKRCFFDNAFHFTLKQIH